MVIGRFGSGLQGERVASTTGETLGVGTAWYSVWTQGEDAVDRDEGTSVSTERSNAKTNFGRPKREAGISLHERVTPIGRALSSVAGVQRVACWKWDRESGFRKAHQDGHLNQDRTPDPAVRSLAASSAGQKTSRKGDRWAVSAQRSTTRKTPSGPVAKAPAFGKVKEQQDRG